MKKTILFLLMILNLFFIGGLVVNAENEHLFAGASYKVIDTIEENYLPYGVNHIKVKAQTTTSMTGYDADGLGSQDALVEPGKPYDQSVNILEVPSNTTVKVTTWANLNNHRWSLTTVRNLITDYEAKNPGWKVIAAINGDFFDINGNNNLPYQTNGALVSNGEFYKTRTSGLIGFRNDGSSDSLVGNEKVDRTDKMILSVYNANGEIVKEFEIDKVNQNPLDNETAIFYANYGSDKKIIPVEVTMDGYYVDKATLALPNFDDDFYGKGEITSTNAKTISTGQFAIVTNNQEVKNALAIGVTIRAQYQYVGAYAGVNDISGAGGTLLANGEDNPAAGINDRAPRTVIGRREDGTIIMMVIDGRQATKGMYGADRTELNAIMTNYGAVEAYNLDGGGSSTMIIKKNGEFVVMNSPSDGRERTDANAIFVVVKEPEIDINAEERTINSVKLNFDLKNNNGHDIKDLYVTLNNETKKIENNTVTFTNLSSNTEYVYSISYKDSSGKTINTLTSGKVKTYKTNPEFLGITIHETADSFIFKVLYNDPDKASGYADAQLYIDDKSAGYFYKDEKTVKKSLFATVGTIKIVTYINIGDGNNVKAENEITNFTIIRTPDCIINEIFMATTEKLLEIYN